ncbi:MAG: hypothetical protein ACLVK5_00485 [Peptoniphilus senegalensis]
MRLQAGLGKLKYGERSDLNNTGQLIIAKVKRVNNKTHTADVILEQGSFIGPAEKGDEETVSCMRLENSQGWHEDLSLAYGRVTPLHEGQLVVVAHIDSMKKKPIIIGSLAPVDSSLTNHPTVMADGELEDEKEEIYDVSQLQEYNYITAHGDFEKVKANGSFITGRREKMSDHRENGFLYNDLTIKNKWTYKTIRALKKVFDYKPFNYLIKTQNTYDDTVDTVYNRFFHDSELGVTRVSRDGKKELFYIELDNEFSIMQQRDSNRRPRKDYEEKKYPHETLRKSDIPNINKLKKPKEIPEFQKINDFTNLKIKENGELEIHYQNKGKATNIIIGESLKINTANPINVTSDNSIEFYSTKTFKVRAPNIDIHESGVTFNDPKKEDKENEWEQQWINPS